MVYQDKVLIIDDDDELRLVMSEALQDNGFEILTAKDGQEGLKMAFENKPNLILLDLVMPGMDGWEVLEKLKEDEWGSSAHVVILTNSDDIGSLTKAIEERGHEYFVKTDWRIDEIVSMVKEKLGL